MSKKIEAVKSEAVKIEDHWGCPDCKSAEVHKRVVGKGTVEGEFVSNGDKVEFRSHGDVEEWDDVEDSDDDLYECDNCGSTFNEPARFRGDNKTRLKVKLVIETWKPDKNGGDEQATATRTEREFTVENSAEAKIAIGFFESIVKGANPLAFTNEK
jgi:ribosomal protein L37AE/L43A